jgi:CDP-diacylglycerol--glycerol-3-phosphate 3-phosphatidyltransferase
VAAADHPIVRNIPNVLTFLRLLAVPVFIGMMIVESGTTFAAGLLFTLAAFTDFFDGFIARRYRLMSQFGKLVDPIADRLLVNSAAILLCIYDDRVLRLEFIAVIARDLVGMWGYYQLRQHVIPTVSRLGKWGMFLMMFGLGWLLMLPDHTWPVWFFWAGLLISIVVMGQYVWRYRWALPGRGHKGIRPGQLPGAPTAGTATETATQEAENSSLHQAEDDVYSSPPQEG